MYLSSECVDDWILGTEPSLMVASARFLSVVAPLAILWIQGWSITIETGTTDNIYLVHNSGISNTFVHLSTHIGLSC